MSAGPAGLWRGEIFPPVLAFAALVTATLLADALLHRLGLAWVGRYLGIVGVLLIAGSFGHSLQKRHWIRGGRPGQLLRWHERMGWAGAWLVLVHAGVHFNAWLAWLAVGAMLVNVASGLTGKFLLGRMRRRTEEIRQQLRAQGLDEAALAERMAWDNRALDAVRQWRVIHLPIALAFAVLGTAHIFSVFLFWGWR